MFFKKRSKREVIAAKIFGIKKYPNYYKNKVLRRKDPNIRKIRDGKPVTYWENK